MTILHVGQVLFSSRYFTKQLLQTVYRRICGQNVYRDTVLSPLLLSKHLNKHVQNLCYQHCQVKGKLYIHKPIRVTRSSDLLYSSSSFNKQKGSVSTYVNEENIALF